MRAKTMEGRELDLKQDTLDGLKLRLRGPVFAPGDVDYEESRTVWNAMIDRKPALVVRCLGSADVIACVEFARANELLLCIKGGGHNIAGLATDDPHSDKHELILSEGGYAVHDAHNGYGKRVRRRESRSHPVLLPVDRKTASS